MRWLLLLCLAGCVKTSGAEIKKDVDTATHQDAEREAVTREVGHAVITKGSDWTLEEFFAAPATPTSTPLLTHRVTHYILPIGVDPRLPPAPTAGPQPAAERVEVGVEVAATSTTRVQRDKVVDSSEASKKTTSLNVGFSWKTWCVIVAAALVAAYAAWRFRKVII